MAENGVILQAFHWYIKSGGTFWKEVKNRASEWAQQGITALWLPPACKGQGGGFDVGYGLYDLFDLGEFDQKGTIPTKYGTRSELLEAIRSARQNGMQVYADVVFNHKDGGDEVEEFWAQEVDWNDRNIPRSDWHKIGSFTHFTFPGRGNTYSSMKWHWWHFDSISFNAVTRNTSRLYRLKARGFETEVSHEHGNYDYLMACDLDMGEDQVRGETMYWGRWFVDVTGVDGFRIDAVKHIRSSYFKDWLNHLRTHFGGKELFSVGEYWSGQVDDLHHYIRQSGGVMSLFDVPLHYKFHMASRTGSAFDMRTIFDRTLVREQPAKAVTFVENHDSQPCQSLESPVEPWFKPLAYALILLRREGYPCIFLADYDGATYSNCRAGQPDVVLYSHQWLIERFLWARKAYGFGDQHDYFDHGNTVGWTRLGTSDHPGAMAVILTNGGDGHKWMNVHRPNATFHDLTEHIADKVRTNSDGWGNFRCRGGSVSVWLQE